ncbi:pyruvate kinase [Patescibacteria group bacterium]|nr:MAG: pyruvate kinase [Patescibacteria group bacterium]
MKKTKIVATLGLVSETKGTIKKMIESGMNVARLNFSHGDFAWHERVIKIIRDLEKKMDVPVGILADLQGPRIRIANDEEISISPKETVLVMEGSGKAPSSGQSKKVILIDLPKIVSLVNVGNEILIEDGLLKLRVVKKARKALECVVVDGGAVKPRKGVNIPGISGKLGALTEQDKKVLKFAIKHDVDYVGISFVRNAKEIQDLKRLINRYSAGKSVAQVVAKIERREAVQNFASILKATDAVMVARGDLGVEMPQTELPLIQKDLISKCLRSAKPVIVATQMMDSMIRNPRPTRAEVSDVSNAVIDHTDAVMLSGESASGKYPVEAVRIMAEIIEKTEKSNFDDLPHGFLEDKQSSISAAVAQSAHELAKDSKAKAIIVASVSGFTARMIARHRADQSVFVVTNNRKTQNQMALVRGVESYLLPECKTMDELIGKAMNLLKSKKALRRGDKVIVVAGRPHVKKEHMSLVKVEEIA